MRTYNAFGQIEFVNAGENIFYRWGKKAVAKLTECLTPNENGFYSVPADGGKYWTFGTSNGKFGEFAKYQDTCFSINRGGFIWAKEGTEKCEKFIEMIKDMIDRMQNMRDTKDEDEYDEE